MFPFDIFDGYMLGMNLHYLPPGPRAKLMDTLYGFANNEKYDRSTKLKLSYDALKQASKWFKPTVHQYITSRIKTSLVEVEPAEWDIALFMPLADWQGATAATVYGDSRTKAKS